MNISRDNIAGSKWWKFDFHTHSPASCDYGKGPDQAVLKQRTPREWLMDFMRAGIDCVAVTDHNSGEWIEKLKQELANFNTEQPSDYRPLHLFPGVEISVNGNIHVLAIFSAEKTSQDIFSLLGAVGYSGRFGHTDCCTTKSVTEVINEVTKSGGIAIPAHVDQSRGLFQVDSGITLKQVLENSNWFAMELHDPAYSKPALYTDLKLHHAEMLGSDAHLPAQVGAQFTWVKMTEPSLAGLRLALLDGPLSLLRSDQTSGDPNSHAPLVVESIVIHDAKYMGHNQPLEVKLNPWLNAIIGGRGAGKSSVLEFLRIALRREDELFGKLKEDFAEFKKIPRSGDDRGLLTEQTQIQAVYRKDGVRYRIQWDQAGTLEAIQEQQAEGSWQIVAGDVRRRFPVRIYSQKQIFELANRPGALLRVVDEAPEVDRASWEEKWREEESRFLALRAKAREIEAGLAEEGSITGELDDVKRKLAVFESAGHKEVLQDYQLRRRQESGIKDWQESFADTGNRLRDLAVQAIPTTLDASLFDGRTDPDKSLLENVQAIADRFLSLRQKIENLAAEADAIVQDCQNKVEESSWKAALNKAEAAYNALVEKLQGAGAGDPSEYGRLVQERQRLEQKLSSLEGKKKTLTDIEKQAQESLSKLGDLRRELTQRRSNFLSKVVASTSQVRIEVIPYGDANTVETEFRELIGKDKPLFQNDIWADDESGLLADLYKNYPRLTSLGEFESRLNNLKQNLNKVRKNSTLLNFRDQRFATYLAGLKPEVFDRLDCWFPGDSLKVTYNPLTDGSSFKPIEQGSPGQKTSAILAFLLAYGDEPMILDQPEDDLDNHLIYDLIVRQLRDNKRRRQIITVTHNPNIVVNGDAELVLALDVRRGQTQIVQQGGLQEQPVRDEICRVMEGGREAFELRYRRISQGGNHV